MHRYSFFATYLLFAACCLTAQDKQSSREIEPQNEFEKQIRPLLIKHCSECHGAEDQSSGLRLDAKHFAFKGGDGGKVIEPMNSAKSELFRRIISRDDDERMPPDQPLSKPQIELIQKWIEAGAVWPETEYDRQAKIDPRLKHWAFQPVEPVKGISRAPYPNPIDWFIVGRLGKIGSLLNDRADRRTLIRRLTLDLTGLPPTPEEVKAFKDDSRKDAYQRLVKRLLKSPRYGERWAQHWLDVVRYADTHGFEVNTPRENAWPYRDYVIKSFNDDKPYDQFVREQIVGDAFGEDSATGFLVASAVLLPGQIGADDESKRLARQDELDEMVVGTGATFLGLSIGCARCHDHKFDPITAEDYYSMQAFFTGVDFGERKVNDAEYQSRLEQVQKLVPEIERVQQKLALFTPPVFSGTSIVIDEADPLRTRYLSKQNGAGVNPSGTKRGYQSDQGAPGRLPNISGGKYTWWNNLPGQDVMYYAPAVEGKFNLWISWGVHGSGVHTRDARYVLDLDGNPETRQDQRELAKIDQYFPAYVTEGSSEKTPRWSGLYFAGKIALEEKSIILLRGGETGTGITADVIVLQSGEIQSDSKTYVPETLASKFGPTKLQGSKPRSAKPRSAKPRSAKPRSAKLHPLPHLRAPVNFRMNVERFTPTRARFVRFTSLATDQDSFREPCLDEFQIFIAGNHSVNVALRSHGAKPSSSGNYGNGTGIHQLAHINDGKFGNSWSWISNKKGQGWVQIELDKESLVERIVWGRDRLGKFKDRLAIRYKIETSIDGIDWKLVASQADRAPFGSVEAADSYRRNLINGKNKTEFVNLQSNLTILQKKKSELEKVKMVYAGRFKRPEPAFVLRRGSRERKGVPVFPAVPALFKTKIEIRDLDNEQARRQKLAEWIASPQNPLTARVIVNRVWANHFGRGLVDTPSDFGVQAKKPEHHLLLDWLAGELIRNNWSIKKLHELIVTSKSYQQASRIRPELQKVDAENRFFWRFESRRLEGEAIRDSMLAVTGELNLKMGGPGFNFFKTRGGLSGFPDVTKFGPNELRRMIYAHKIRMERVPVFGAFDCPDAGQAMPKRSRSTTAIQALNLFNSQFVFERSLKFAARVRKDTGSSSHSDWINRAFELAIGRLPSQKELQASVEVVEQHGLDSLCRALFNSNEFLFLP